MNPDHALAWLLLGALLSNEISTIVRSYGFDFCVLEDIPDPDNTEYFYEGDDLDKRFPGIEWVCDRCGNRLDLQPGFDDHCKIWRCLNCGYDNPIEITEIYNSEKDWLEDADPVDPQKFYRALRKRTDEKNS